MDHPKGSCHTEIKNLAVTERGLKILKNISLNLLCGSFSALIGPNGAGKTTLLRCLIGDLRHSGEVFFNGKRRLPRVGYVPQKMTFDADNPCTVLDLFILTYSRRPLFFGKREKDTVFAAEALKSVSAAYLIDRPLQALSGGELRRVFLALALAGKPEILLLDEAVTGLDRNGMELFYRLIAQIRREYDLSILMVSHDFDLIERYADYAYLLDDGVLADEGIPKDLFTRKAFRSLFGKIS
jgi:zinc transport system ATP-binding protein